MTLVQHAVIACAGVYRTSIKEVFVGGDDFVTARDFVLSDGTHIALNDPVWNAGEPSGGVEHCLSIETSLFKLNDLDCSLERPFICQIDM